MEKQQIKKQIKQAINSAVYNHVEKHYPSFHIELGEDGGRVYFTPKKADRTNELWSNTIKYHRSRHEFCVEKSADLLIKIMVKELERVVDETKLQFN